MVDRITKRPILVDGDGRLIIVEAVRTCPSVPVDVPGITVADAFDANDCLGTVMAIPVPKAGIIQSATYFDMDDEGTQVDFMVFKNNFTFTASDAVYAPTDADLANFVTGLQFATFIDHGTGQTAQLVNNGVAYSAPKGVLYVQAVCRGTPTIAASNLPKFQMQIISLDPTFEV